MAKTIQLKATERTVTGRHRTSRLRNSGRVPAILYGKSTGTKMLELDSREFQKAIQKAAAENVLVDLARDGQPNTLALIQQVQHHPVTGKVLHIDFHSLAADEKMHTHVPVETFGTPIGIKVGGGILEHIMREVEVSCLPKDLPELITVDISNLELGKSLHVSDLPLPEGVTAVSGKELVICQVSAPRTDEAVAATDQAQPEVIKEKKPAEGAAAGGKDAGKKDAGKKPEGGKKA